MIILIMEVIMKSKKQSIKCDVYDCSNCNEEDNCCNLEEIKISNCDNKKTKRSTICDSYDKKNLRK